MSFLVHQSPKETPRGVSPRHSKLRDSGVDVDDGHADIREGVRAAASAPDWRFSFCTVHVFFVVLVCVTVFACLFF